MRTFSLRYQAILRSSEKSLRNKLRARNWTDEEIDSHYPSANEADVFYMFSAQAFIVGLFNKYLSLSLRLGSTEISRAILIRKIIDSLTQLVAYVYKHSQDVNAKSPTYDKDFSSTYVRLIFSFNRQIRDFIKEYSEEGTVRESYKTLPPTFVAKINNRFLKRLRSIGNMYEFAYKRGDIERNEIPD